MKIFAISVVKNEVDVLAKSIAEATKWADKIFILDNGSTDGTWELAQSLASEKVIPWCQDTTPFYDGIRARVFQKFKHLAAEGDWWCFRLDADEFYADNPKEFLAKVPWYHHFVVTDTIQFRLTKEDFANGRTPASVDDIRYHDKLTWSEARFFRHREKLNWTPAMERPKHMGIMHSRRIKLRHYQFRSLRQIEQRIKVRAEAKQNGYPGFEYSVKEDINSYLLNRADLNHYEGSNVYAIEGVGNKLYQRWYDIMLKFILHTTNIYK